MPESPTTVKAERDALREAFDDIVIWAARYAHGRATPAPGSVRRAVAVRKQYDPTWAPPGRAGLEPLLALPDGLSLQSDDLTDVFPETS